jgi:hypothetical protein
MVQLDSIKMKSNERRLYTNDDYVKEHKVKGSEMFKRKLQMPRGRKKQLQK